MPQAAEAAALHVGGELAEFAHGAAFELDHGEVAGHCPADDGNTVLLVLEPLVGLRECGAVLRVRFPRDGWPLVALVCGGQDGDDTDAVSEAFVRVGEDRVHCCGSVKSAG